MPPFRVRAPLSLEMLCFWEVMSHIHKELLICAFIRRFEKTSLILRSRDINADALQIEIASYLSKLPPLLSENVRQEITNKLMSSRTDVAMPYMNFLSEDLSETVQSGRNIIIAMLDVVLNHEISSIEFSNDGQVTGTGCTARIWSLILRCSGLKRLVLKQGMFASDLKKVPPFTTPFLTKLTLNCPLLTELVLNDIVTGSEQLRVIGQNCHQLQKLDISGSRGVTNLNILHLCFKPGPDGSLMLPSNKFSEEPGSENLTPLCRTLNALILTNTGVRAKGAGFLLRAIPNLTTLGDLVYTAAGLKSIYVLLKAKKCRTLRLKHVFYRGPSNIKLKILANCCPNLESLYLGSKTERRIQCPLHLNPSCFNKLTFLALENIHSDDIALALQHTPSLLKLTVDCNHLDVSLISKYCPKLRELRLIREPSKQMKHWDSHPDRCCFQELQQITFHSPISCEVANAFFANALKLRLVEIVRVRDASDAVFMSWVMKNPLVHLESLVIRYIELTRVSVDWLLSNCTNLTKLGELGGWDIRSWECRRIKDYCVAKNYDLDLMVYTTVSSDVYDIFNDQSDDSDSTLSI